jgi:hypothetical protein
VTRKVRSNPPLTSGVLFHETINCVVLSQERATAIKECSEERYDKMLGVCRQPFGSAKDVGMVCSGSRYAGT